MKYFASKTDLLKSGIYKIINTHSNRVYIGQTIRTFKERWNEHSSCLLNDNHDNIFLQNDYNKCKKELERDPFLEFSILEITENFSKEYINFLEEFYIIAVYDNQEQCYNFKKTSRSSERLVFSHSLEESKQKLKESNRKFWESPESIKTRQHASEVSKKYWEDESNRKKQTVLLKTRWSNLEFIEKMSEISNSLENVERTSKFFKEKWQDSEFRKNQMLIRNSKEFKDNLKQKNIIAHTTPERIAIKKETVKKQLEKDPEFYTKLIAHAAEFHAKTFTFKSPEGIIFSGKNITKFSKENNLDKSGMHRVANGVWKQYKGWTKA